MQHSIRSELLTAVIDTNGAELVSLKDKDGNEYIWTAEDVWKRHAPVLFPFVCNTLSKKYTVEGKEYALSNHGFARDTDFDLTVSEDDSVSVTLASSETTKSVYPYDFIFQICYALKNNTLTVKMDVTNTGDKDMPFFVGGHPGFICPFAADKDSTFEDYDIVYEKRETIIQQLPDGDNVVLDNADTVPNSRELYKNDVFLKDKPASSYVSLVSRKSGKKITVSYDNSGCIAVWSPYDDRASFVCLEPWAQSHVYMGGSDELTEMTNAHHIAPQEKFSFSFDITVE